MTLLPITNKKMDTLIYLEIPTTPKPTSIGCALMTHTGLYIPLLVAKRLLTKVEEHFHATYKAS